MYYVGKKSIAKASVLLQFGEERLKFLHTRKNRSLNFAVIFYQMTHNSECNCALKSCKNYFISLLKALKTCRISCHDQN